MTDDFMGVSACPICGGPLDNRNPISHRCTGVPDARRRQIAEEYDIVREQMRDERIAILDDVRHLVAEEAVKIMSLTRDSKEQGSISRLYAAIVTAIDAMKEER